MADIKVTGMPANPGIETGDLFHVVDVSTGLSTKATIEQVGAFIGDSIPVLAAAPATGAQGDLYYNTTDDTLYAYDGTTWVAVGPSVGGGAGAFELSGTTIKETGLTGTSTNDFVVGADDLYNTTNGGGRLMFDAGKTGAFRVGRYYDAFWGDAQVGDNSFATGQSTVASAQRSAAFGFNTTASESNATAFGQQSQATARNSLAAGYQALAQGPVGTAFANKFAFGDRVHTTATSGLSQMIIGRYGQSNTTSRFSVASGSTGDQNTEGAGLIFDVKDNGVVNMSALPTTAVGLVAGDLWNNAGVINIV